MPVEPTNLRPPSVVESIQIDRNNLSAEKNHHNSPARVDKSPDHVDESSK